MAEPISAAASVAGLASLVIQVSQLSYQYFLSLKCSSKAWSEYIQELSSLTVVLKNLQQASDGVRSQDPSVILPALSLPSESIRECHQELDNLKLTLSRKLQKRGLRRKLELLSWPFSESDTQAKVLKLQRFSNRFASLLVADNLTISIESCRQLKDRKDIEEFEKLLNWFKPSYESLPLSYEAALESICPGTRSAFLSSDIYVSWRDTLGGKIKQLLWIHGPPGSGKSILSAAIVNDLMSHSDTIVAYHFFRDNQEETLHDVLRHIAHQLISQPTAVSQLAINICKKKMARNASPLPTDLVDVICDISVTSGRTYIIMDGLDEFSHFKKLLKYVPRFVAAKAKVIVSSRELPTIQIHMKDVTLVDARAGHQDTELYVHWRLDEDSEADNDLLAEDLKREIVSTLVEQSNGSFLLARLIMDSICKATTIIRIRTLLESMPTNYGEAYSGTLDRILKQDKERQILALSALAWTCKSKRSLNMIELQHAIASLAKVAEYTVEYLEFEKAILSSCLGLLVHSKSSQTVALVHTSAREFIIEQLDSFLNRFDSLATTWNALIGSACLRYMSVPEMAKGPCQSLHEFKARITEMPFLDYTTRYYGYHVHPVEDDFLDELVSFLSDEQCRESSWQMLHFVVGTGSQSAQDSISGVPNQATIMHVACYWGLYYLFQKSLAMSRTVSMLNKRDSHGWSPLHWASSNGHYQLVAGLLEAGADINALDKASWTPLFWAVVRGHDQVSRLLLHHGSNPSEQDENGFTPVHWAILAGAEEMTALLLKHANEWALRSAPWAFKDPPGTWLTVEEAKAIVEPKPARNLFELAMDVSDKESFEKLLNSHGSQTYRIGETYGLTTSHVGALWNLTKTALFKSEIGFWSRGKKKSPIDAIRRKLLFNAIRCEDIGLVKTMFNFSRDLGKDLASDVVSSGGAGYVHVAAAGKSTEIMRIIISQTESSLTKIDSMENTPLHYACNKGSREIMEMILEANVEVDARNKQQRTPLMVLLLSGGKRTCHTPGETLMMFKALMAKGASIQASDSEGLQVIHYSMAAMDPDIVQTLVDLGANPGAVSNDLRTPLHVFAEGINHYISVGGYEREDYFLRPNDDKLPPGLVGAVLKLICRVSPPEALRAETAANATALALAIKSHRWILAQALHITGAPFRYNDDLSDMLEDVSEKGFYEFVRILIKAGATPKKVNCFRIFPDILRFPKRHSRDQWPADVSGAEAFPRRNHTLTLRELLAIGVNINHKIWHHMTLIQMAVEGGINDTTYIAALIEGGADPYSQTDGALDSFDLALQCGTLENLAILVQHAARDPSREHWLTNWFRESGAIPQGDQESFEACIAAIGHSRLYAAQDKNGKTPLFYAVREGNTILAEELIKLGSDVNSADPFGWTPFHEAVRAHRTDLVELLISKGANVFATVKDTSPFSSSSSTFPDAEEKEPRINALHIAVGINPYYNDPEARERFSPDIVRQLLEKGIDPNSPAMYVGSLSDCVSSDGIPLHIMFRRSRFSRPREFFAVVQLLIDFGADVGGIAEWLELRDIASFEGYESLWEIFRNAEPVNGA